METPATRSPSSPSGCTNCDGGHSHTAARPPALPPPGSSASLQPFHEFASFDEGRAALAALLNLPQPVEADVLLSAIEDVDYARNLIVSRNTRTFLDYLLANPPKRYDASAPGLEMGNAALVGKAAKSLWTWARSGLQEVSADAYQQRLSACAACPHHTEPPQRLIYKLAGASGRSVCGLCGCATARKAKLPHESCPDPAPTRPGFTRWGEPIIA